VLTPVRSSGTFAPIFGSATRNAAGPYHVAKHIEAFAILKPLILALIAGLIIWGASSMATKEPPFAVQFAQGNFELRDYPALAVAEVAVRGERKEAAGKGFRLLAHYIFGGNTRNQSIAMTAPVTQQAAANEKIAMTAPVIQAGGDGNWVIRFIMPEGATLDSLPRPHDPTVQLRILPPERIAVVRFSGFAREEAVASNTAALQSFIVARQLQATGPAVLAQYNPPWTLWFLRRNEVMIPVAR
jgi:hypothetical protein